ncbi:MAG: type secretion protein [Proteobacteria bacterium]|nr:type secretion protein [Pseudomonadota bacterium]
MSIFDEILSIKNFRENRAELAMFKQRTVLEAAMAARDEAQKILSAFIEEALRREHNLYQDLCSRLVRLRDIESVQMEVVDLRHREHGYEENLVKSEQARTAEEQRLDEAKQCHQQAVIMKQKFVELVEVYNDEYMKQAERAEDAEMEEVAELRHDRVEWGDDFEEVAV